jgi:hypothetical protein
MTSSGSGALATCTGTVSACPTGCTGAGGVATCP